MLILRTRRVLVDKILAFGALVGTVFLILGVWMINDTAVLLGGSQEATAIVVDYNNKENGYFPIVEFKDKAGSIITAQSIYGSAWPQDNIGYEVSILYNSINPSGSVRINNLENVWLGPIFLTVMGAFNLVLSLGLYWKKL